jgi:hypothetical protein
MVKIGKVVPLRPIEAHLGDRRYSSRRGWVVSITPRPRFTPGQRAPGTHCTGGWVGPRAGLNAQVRGKIFCLCRGSNAGSPVRSQTLYWLSYPGSFVYMLAKNIYLLSSFVLPPKMPYVLLSQLSFRNICNEHVTFFHSVIPLSG